MLVALLVLAVVAFVVAAPLVAAITPGSTRRGSAKTVDLTRIMLVAPILLALGAVATSALNADRRFARVRRRPDRLQPRDHRRRGRSSATPSA